MIYNDETGFIALYHVQNLPSKGNRSYIFALNLSLLVFRDFVLPIIKNLHEEFNLMNLGFNTQSVICYQPEMFVFFFYDQMKNCWIGISMTVLPSLSLISLYYYMIKALPEWSLLNEFSSNPKSFIDININVSCQVVYNSTVIIQDYVLRFSIIQRTKAHKKIGLNV